MPAVMVCCGRQTLCNLDPTTRKIPSRRTSSLISDTVGFIKTPHQLIEAFKATLEEWEADLLLFMSDCSHSNAGLQIESVKRCWKR
jgi:50S ribosomal subunit-associated GTPase HflX